MDYFSEEWLDLKEISMYFESIGLMLTGKGYWKIDSKPHHLETFATTWGDFVSFAIDRNTWKIYVVVPWWNVVNIVIANSFQDFIEIWSKNWFFNLEQISYDLQHFVNYYNWFSYDFDWNRQDNEIEEQLIFLIKVLQKIKISMNRLKITKSYIKDYLDVVFQYAKDFYPLYLDRTNIKEVEWFEYYPYWNWILIKDIKNDIEVDFDYFRYKTDWIKYFDLWKVNKFIINQWKVDEITKETWSELEERWYIKKYFKSSYYYII